MREPRGAAPFSWPLAAALGVALALGIGWWVTREPPAAGSSEAATPIHAEPRHAAPAAQPAEAPEAPAAEPGGLVIESGGRLVIRADELPSGEPLVVQLRLGEPSADAAPRPVRVAAVDGRTLELEGRLGADRMAARIDLDPAWLRPGRYLVEVRTTERTHFPARRYVIEVR